MKHQKLPNDLSVEELLLALDQQEKPTSQDGESNPNLIPMPEYVGQLSESNPVYSFVEAFKLKPGNHLVSSHILYNLYKLWNKMDGRNHQSFSYNLGLYLPKQKTQSSRLDIVYFKVNEKGAKLSYYTDQYFKFNKRKHISNKNHRKHYEKFFQDINLTPGPLFVEADVLYHVYDTYMYRHKRKSHPFLRFQLICELFFEKKYLGGNNIPWFGVSENIKQLVTPEAVANWREGRKHFNGKTSKIKEEDKAKILYPEKE